MEKRSLIIRLFGLFMLASVLLNGFTPARAMVVKQAIAQQSEDEEKEKTPSISEWTSEVVVPSHAFSFDGSMLLVPAPACVFILAEEVAAKVSRPLYRHSYFEKLYEHHIAINAP